MKTRDTAITAAEATIPSTGCFRLGIMRSSGCPLLRALHKKSIFKANELPAWIRRGGCALKKISRSFLNARRRGGRLSSTKNLFWNLIDRPVRSTRCCAKFLDVAATPPDPGEEFAPQKWTSCAKPSGGVDA